MVRYVPLLRSKVGEATALGHLTTQAKDKIFPIIQAIATPPVTFAPAMVQAWGERPMALDGMFTTGVTGSAANFIALFDALGTGGAAVVPSISQGAPNTYLNAVLPLIGQYGPGLAVRTAVGQLPQITAWTANFGWAPHDIDLVIETGEVANHDVQQFSHYVAHVLNTAIQQNPIPWRSITLAASAAPQNLGGFAVGRTDLPRKDWQVWQAVAGELPFNLDYGDYAHVHPALAEPPGVAMVRAPISVRYTSDYDWVILKGRPTSGQNGVPMDNQYRAHAATLAALPSFGGIANCWGDQRIEMIANGAPRAGSRASWVAILANRHLSIVADRV